MANLKRTREDILQAVIGTVHRQGLVATSLSELFAASGASAGSFYNYFQSKHHLGHALIDFEWELLSAKVLTPAFASDSDPIDKIIEMLNRLEAKQLEQPNCGGCLLGNLVVDLVEQDPAFRDHLTRIFDQWQQTIAAALAQVPERLQVGTDPQAMAAQLLVMIEGAMLMGRLYQTPERIKGGFAGVHQFFQSYLRP